MAINMSLVAIVYTTMHGVSRGIHTKMAVWAQE